MRRTQLLCSLVAGGAIALTAACDDAEFKGAEAEVTRTDIKLDLPSVPDFDVPEPESDGTNGVVLMRLQGHNMLDEEVEVKGYVTWIYDCAETIKSKEPDLTDKEIQKLIYEKGSRCDLPHFYMGEEPDTPPEKSVWVVEVPRELKDWERKQMTKEELAERKPVPVYEVGDEVVVKGKWARQSPEGFARTNGLLVYAELENLTKAEEEEE